MKAMKTMKTMKTMKVGLASSSVYLISYILYLPILCDTTHNPPDTSAVGLGQFLLPLRSVLGCSPGPLWAVRDAP